MIVVRWVAFAFALVQILAYDDQPYPEHIPVFALALTAAGILALGNTLAWLALPWARTGTRARGLAVATLALDIAVASAIVWLWAFDPGSALWAVLFIPPLEGAIKFQLVGALSTWLAVTAIYVGREFWGEATYADFDLQWNSITFRMGIGLIIAMVAGFIARNLTRQKQLLEAALARLRHTDRLRSSLVSTLAHDVRNPLAAIRGTIRTLLNRAGRIEEATSMELLSTADRQAARLERLAADLLDLARLERGRLELSISTVRVDEVVREALTYVDTPEAFEVRVADDLRLRVDAGRLEQILVNLATNAIRYGKPPFEVEAAREGEDVEITVRDHGRGVPPDERAFVFEPFRTERHDASVGFGLAIVKALAEAHGGGVEYRDNEPTGACFVVRLPAGNGREAAEEGSAPRMSKP
jgi:signal transduction histidine kinase